MVQTLQQKYYLEHDCYAPTQQNGCTLCCALQPQPSGHDLTEKFEPYLSYKENYMHCKAGGLSLPL